MRIAILILLAIPALSCGDSPELKAARKDYETKINFIRQDAIDDIKGVIYKVQDSGGTPNFLIRELDGFKDKGVLPITPKLLPISQRYVRERKKADEAFIEALTAERTTALKKGDVEAAIALRKEIAKLRDDMAGREQQAKK